MARPPNDLRNREVPDVEARGSSAGKWIAIVVAILVVLVLAWFFGVFADVDSAVVPEADGAATVTE